MAGRKRYPLRERIRVAAGILLVAAALSEAVSVLWGYGAASDGRLHLLFALASFVTALPMLFGVRGAVYVALPVVLAIFFFEVYRMASISVSVYAAVSVVLFLAAALLCFTLIRIYKI
jgi:hypothetical protein